MSEPFRILFVCTGNICRSPAAERLLQAALQPPQPGDAEILVASAGTHALIGYPIDPATASALVDRRIDAQRHEARTLTVANVAEADLVLGATRAHRAAAVSLYPKAVHYSYTVNEFARLVVNVLSEPGYEPSSPASLLANVRAARGVVRAANPTDDDLADPYGHTAGEHSVAVATIAAATEVMAVALSRQRPATQPSLH